MAGMMLDPVQALIDAGAIPTSPFAPTSRYAPTPLGLFRPDPAQPGIAYVLRRFIPQRRDIATVGTHFVTAGERPDLLGYTLLGDAELYWRVADANAVTDPFDLTDTIGARVAIPTAPGT